MQRLVALTLLLVTGVSQLQAQQQVHHYTIAGDVDAPQTYQWPITQPVTVRDLLQQAGANGAAGRAFVLRGSERSLAAVEQSMPGHPYLGLPLASGDVVIFQASHRQPRSGSSNAVICVNSIPDLQPMEDATFPLSALLDGMSFPTTLQVRVTRIERDEPVSMLLGIDGLVLHGDVVHLAESVSAAGLQIADLKLPYYQPPAKELVETTAEIESAFTQATEHDRTTEFFQTAEVPDRQLALTIPGGEGEQQESDRAFFSAAQPKNPWSDNGQMELRAVASEPLSSGDGNPSPAAESDTAVIRPVSLRSNSEDVFSERLSPDVSPVTADAGSNAIWNVVFIGGLLFAMGLIIVGWLKTQQEREMEVRMNDHTRESLRTATPVIGENLAKPEDSRAACELETAQPPGTVDNEFISANDDCPVLSAGFSLESSDEDFNAVYSTDDSVEVAQFDAHPAAPSETVYSNPANEVVDANRWFGETSVETKSDAPVESMQTTTPAAVTADVNADVVKQAPAPAAAIESAIREESWGELEDLIQNRLPMELTELQLPLKISLFGRPAGPRRLRIDTAHTEIAAPHMAKKSRRSRSSEPVTATSVSSPSVGTSGGRTKANADFSGLDKALNYLEEQSGS